MTTPHNPAPDSQKKGQSWLLGWTCISLAGSLLLLHALWFYPFFSDDAFISLVYADRLLQGQGLTWSDGAAVEGYSNLLWVLTVSALGFLQMDLVWAGRLACLIPSLFCIVAIYLTNRQNFPTTLTPSLVGLLFLVCNGPLACWSQGGLEATLQAALLLALGILLSKPNTKNLCLGSICLALLTINRPEGLLFTPLSALIVTISLKTHTRPTAPEKNRFPTAKALATLVLLPLLTAASHLLFRILYYQDWVPNTFHAKFALTSTRTQQAQEYLEGAVLDHLPLVVFGLVVTALYLLPIKTTERRQTQRESIKRLCPKILLAGGWLSMVVLGGGDIFPAYRHIVPLLPISILALTEIIGTCITTQKIRPHVVWATAILTSLATLYVQFNSPEIQNARKELYPWRGKQIAEVLRESWKTADPPPLTAVTCAGALTYYLKMPVLDMHGLNDKTLPRMKTQTFGHGRMGHELINIPYILGKKPDAIISHLGEPFPEHGMENYEAFSKDYQLIRLSKLPSFIGSPAGIQPYLFIRKEKEAELLKPWMEPISLDPTHNPNTIDFKPEHIQENEPNSKRWHTQSYHPTWKNRSQLLLTPLPQNPATKHTLTFPSPKTGNLTTKLHYTKAPDYGIAHIHINGKLIPPLDGYNPTVNTDHAIITSLPLHQENNTLTITIPQKNKKSEGYLFGLDALEILPQEDTKKPTNHKTE